MQEDIVIEQQKNAEISKIILGYFTYLQKRWYVILLAGVLGGIAGFTYAYFDEPVYSATLSFVLEDEKSSGSGALGLASQLGLDLGGTSNASAFSGANIVELMKSRSSVEKALLSPVLVNGKQTTFAELYIDFNEWRKKGKENNALNSIYYTLNLDRSKFDLKRDSILGIIYKSLITENLSIVQRDKRVSIFYITVKSKNEFFSKNFTEILAKVVSEFYIETKTKKSTQNMLILQNQVDSIRSELNIAMLGVASYTDNNYNLNPAMVIKRVPSAKKQIDVQTNSAILAELVKNLELSKVSLRKETPLIQIIDKPIFPLDKQKQSKSFSLIVGFILASAVSIFCLIIYFLTKRK